jgi:tRNA modification GTPase
MEITLRRRPAVSADTPPTTTIFAQASTPGRAAVAIVRLSGPTSRSILQAMAAPLPAPRRASLRTIRHPRTGDPLDQGLAVWMPAPASFTGEDCAELHVHGGRAVVRAVLAALGMFPQTRLAEPGEFARRAFLNGRIDLTAAEGLADLIDAETEGQRRQALRQASAGLAAVYDGWRERLLAARALVEAAIDFADEGDVGTRAFMDARAVADSLAREIDRHVGDGRRGEILRDGFRVVIAGRPNAGKSSLLNALARRDVAIVSDEPGTTRDALEVRLDLDGWPVLLTDTAGLRAAEGAIEREGVRRALAHAGEADLVIWLSDASAPGEELPPELASAAGRTWRVASKADLVCDPMPAAAAQVSDRAGLCLRVSSRTGEGLEALTSALASEAARRLASLGDPVITQARHRQHLTDCQSLLTAFMAGDADQLELRAEELRLAADALGRITGRIDPEHVLDVIFSRFCIGK